VVLWLIQCSFFEKFDCSAQLVALMFKLNLYVRVIPAYVQVPAPAVPLLEVETFSEQFQDAQSPIPDTPYEPDQPDAIEATQVDGDGSEKQPSEARSIVVEPAAKDIGAEREALLKNALPTPPGAVSPVAVHEPHDWKRSPDPIAHAEKLCEELTETQMNDLMSKYSSVASSKGDVGLIRPDQLDEASRMSFFETLEQMVLMNRKTLSMDKVDVVKVKPSAAPCQAGNLKIAAPEASTGGVPEAVQAPAVPEPSTGGLPDPVGSVPECGGSGAVPEPVQPSSGGGPDQALAVPAPTVAPSQHGAAEAAATAPPEGGSMQVVPHSSQNRELELAGLQALMSAQKGREAAQLEQAQRLQPRVAVTAATEKLDWTTHKKEGMRLKRLLEDSSEGARFPHMKKLFNEGSKEDWVR
jgi:hypothetical protein